MNYRTMVKGAPALSLSLTVASAMAATSTTNGVPVYGATFEAVASQTAPLNDYAYEEGTNITKYADAQNGKGWFSGAEEDESKIVAGGVTGGSQALQLNTDAATLTNKFASGIASGLNAAIAGAGAFFETDVKFVASDTLDAGITGGTDATKFAIYAYVDESDSENITTNLVVFHGVMDSNGDITYTNEVFESVEIDTDVYTKLRIEMRKLVDPENVLNSYNAFSVVINDGDPLSSDTALDALFNETQEGTWFLTVESDAIASNHDVASLNFKGTGEIDNIVAGTNEVNTTYAINWTGSENVVVSNALGEVSGTSGNYESGVVLTFYPTVGLITNAYGAAVDPAAASWTFTVADADATFTVFAGEEPSTPTYAVSWTVSKVAVSNTTDSAAVVEAVAGSFEAGTKLTFYPEEGSITNLVVNGSPVDPLPEGAYEYVVLAQADQTIVAKAGQASQQRVKPAWASAATDKDFFDWVDAFNVENYNNDYTAQYLMNVDETADPILKIDSIVVTAEGSQIVVSAVDANNSNAAIDLAAINGVLNVSVGSSVTALTSKAIPANNKGIPAAGKVSVIIKSADGAFAKATVDFTAASNSLSEVVTE